MKVYNSKLFCLLCLLGLSLLSCSSQVKLNRLSHTQGVLPTKLIWLQIPGLSYEQLSIVKLLADDLSTKNEFEKFHCTGSISNFSLSNMRGETEFSFLSQMTGMSSIDECSDYESAALWKLVPKKRFSVGIFKDHKVETKCSQRHSQFYSEATQWIMAEPDKQGPQAQGSLNFFHSDETSEFQKGQIYFDKSCSSGQCFSSYDENIKNTLSRFIKNKNFYMYIAQIDTYNETLKKAQISLIKNELVRISKLVSFIKRLIVKEFDATLLITSSASKGIELPINSKDWESQLSGKKVMRFRRNQTQSPVFAYGANAESFCGVFHESEVAKRLLTTP